MLILPLINTSGDNKKLRNLDSTLDSAFKEPRDHEKVSFTPPSSLSSFIGSEVEPEGRGSPGPLPRCEMGAWLEKGSSLKVK